MSKPCVIHCHSNKNDVCQQSDYYICRIRQVHKNTTTNHVHDWGTVMMSNGDDVVLICHDCDATGKFRRVV